MGLLKHKHLQGLTRLTVYTLVHSGKIARGCSFKKNFFFKTADTVFLLNTPSLTFILLARGCSVCHFLKSKLLIQFFLLILILTLPNTVFIMTQTISF